MKFAKILSLLLCLAMIFSLVSCSLADLGGIIGKTESSNTSTNSNVPNWKEELEKNEQEKEEMSKGETEEESREEENESQEPEKEPEVVYGSVEYYMQQISKSMANARVKVTTEENRLANGNPINIVMVCYYDGANWEQESTYGMKVMCVDDTVYYSSSYQNIKNKLPNASQHGFESASSAGVNDSNGGINAYETKEVVENGDGTITIKLEGASDSFKELMGANTPDEQSQEITIDENYCILSVVIHQVTGSTTLDSTATYSYDEARDVVAPADADEYNEVASLEDLYR